MHSFKETVHFFCQCIFLLILYCRSWQQKQKLQVFKFSEAIPILDRNILVFSQLVQKTCATYEYSLQYSADFTGYVGKHGTLKNSMNKELSSIGIERFLSCFLKHAEFIPVKS